MSKSFLLKTYQFSSHIKVHIMTSKVVSTIPFFGKYIALFLDRFLFILYGIELESRSINIKHLHIPHPGGILLGGNGIKSNGHVAIMAGVKFVAKSPNDSNYLYKQRKGKVFELGSKVFIGANSTIIGPVKICSNVVIGAMSLVNKDILKPGVYVGIPAQRILSSHNESWFDNL